MLFFLPHQLPTNIVDSYNKMALTDKDQSSLVTQTIQNVSVLSSVLNNARNTANKPIVSASNTTVEEEIRALFTNEKNLPSTNGNHRNENVRANANPI